MNIRAVSVGGGGIAGACIKTLALNSETSTPFGMKAWPMVFLELRPRPCI
jgi:hypothetical protein